MVHIHINISIITHILIYGAHKHKNYTWRVHTNIIIIMHILRNDTVTQSNIRTGTKNIWTSNSAIT